MTTKFESDLYYWLDQLTERSSAEELLQSVVQERKSELNNAADALMQDSLNLPTWHYNQEEAKLRLLIELLIIHQYKEFEINLKTLTKAIYPDDFVQYRNFYDFEKLFKKKGIDFSGLKSYESLNQLREVNNAIKHSQYILCDKVINLNISQFEELQELNQNRKNNLPDRDVGFHELDEFYNRVKNSTFDFLNELATKISKSNYQN